MKRFLLITSIILLVRTALLAQEQEIIKINDEASFREIAKATLYEGKSFHKVKLMLTQDIVLQGDSILPIGMYPTENEKSFPFQGEFDGGGHTITINAPFSIYESSWIDDYGHKNYEFFSGLFGIVGVAGIVKNLNVEIENIQSAISMGQIGSFGVISGTNAGLILNCNVSGSYSIASTTHNFFEFGSIAGYLTSDGMVCNSSNSAKLIANKISVVGGIVGKSQSGIISKSYNAGDIIIEECTSFGGDGRCVGGIVGENTGTGSDLSPYVVNCINYGRIKGNSNIISSGGIAGVSKGDGIIFYCGNVGDILCDAEYCGGIVGRLISSSVLGSYQAGCLCYYNGEKDKNKAVGIRWWGDEPIEESYIIGNCNRKISPDLFVRKANAYYPKAEAKLSKYLQVDKKSYSNSFHAEPWKTSLEQPFPYIAY